MCKSIDERCVWIISCRYCSIRQSYKAIFWFNSVYINVVGWFFAVHHHQLLYTVYLQEHVIFIRQKMSWNGVVVYCIGSYILTFINQNFYWISRCFFFMSYGDSYSLRFQALHDTPTVMYRRVSYHQAHASRATKNITKKKIQKTRFKFSIRNNNIYHNQNEFICPLVTTATTHVQSRAKALTNKANKINNL